MRYAGYKLMGLLGYDKSCALSINKRDRWFVGFNHIMENSNWLRIRNGKSINVYLMMSHVTICPFVIYYFIPGLNGQQNTVTIVRNQAGTCDKEKILVNYELDIYLEKGLIRTYFNILLEGIFPFM
jgi:hypothetical protein